MKMIKITFEGVSYFAKEKDTLAEAFEAFLDEGDPVNVQIELTQEEFNNLPEFEGF